MNDILVKRKRILIFIDWFEPGFKAGGIIRSCANFAEHMKSDYDIYILTRDRDIGDTGPYKSIAVDKWITNNARLNIFYASPGALTWKNILKQIMTIEPAYIYLNSMFSRYFSIYLLLMKRLGKITSKVVLAPNGMLRKTALAFKREKKACFLQVFKRLKIHRYITFHATDLTEEDDIKHCFGSDVVVNTISAFAPIQPPFVSLPKIVGELKMILVGRIHPVKNVHLLLQCLQSVKATVHLTLIAIVEDEAYWTFCECLVQTLPKNVTVSLVNDLPHQKIEGMLKEHHLFCLPTKGENFGYAIFEALAAGRPVLISDQTPWKDLATHKAGWDISLTDAPLFTEVIEKVASMQQEEYEQWGRGAWQYASDYIHRSDIKEQYLKLFN